MKKFTLLLLIISLSQSAWAQFPGRTNESYDYPPSPTYSQDRIQMAVILDVSGSMEGLLEQTKAQLWHIVNGLTWSADPYSVPTLEIALYAYGQDAAGRRNGYVRQIIPFTTDLDWVSEALWGLYTGGRYEYAGAAIQASLTELNWSRRNRDLKMIYIAGNEVFEQGPVASRQALRNAQYQGIIVNTIYCGKEYEGRRQGWEQAAYQGGGDFLAIEQNYRDNYQRYTPYDQQIIGLNRRFNDTYIPYGRRADICRQRQISQDRRASQLGIGIAAQRAIAKSSSVYTHPDWDLVDAVSSGQVQLDNIPASELPLEMQRMSLAERKSYVSQKARARRAISQEIQQLAQQARQKEIQTQSPGPVSASPNQSGAVGRAKVQTLDGAIIQSANKQRQIQAAGGREKIGGHAPRTLPEDLRQGSSSPSGSVNSVPSSPSQVIGGARNLPPQSNGGIHTTVRRPSSSSQTSSPVRRRNQTQVPVPRSSQVKQAGTAGPSRSVNQSTHKVEEVSPRVRPGSTNIPQVRPHRSAQPQVRQAGTAGSIRIKGNN